MFSFKGSALNVFCVHSMQITPLGLISAEYTPDTLDSYNKDHGGDGGDDDDDHEDNEDKKN